MVCGTILNVWGCITTCNDRLVIYQVSQEKTSHIYYIVSEQSIEVNTYYTYKEKQVPSVIQDVIRVCQQENSYVSHDVLTGRRVLYGPHLTRKQRNVRICEIPKEYIEKVVEFEEHPEDAKIRLFYKWLTSLLELLF